MTVELNIERLRRLAGVKILTEEQMIHDQSVPKKRQAFKSELPDMSVRGQNSPNRIVNRQGDNPMDDQAKTKGRHQHTTVAIEEAPPGEESPISGGANSGAGCKCQDASGHLNDFGSMLRKAGVSDHDLTAGSLKLTPEGIDKVASKLGHGQGVDHQGRSPAQFVGHLLGMLADKQNGRHTELESAELESVYNEQVGDDDGHLFSDEGDAKVYAMINDLSDNALQMLAMVHPMWSRSAGDDDLRGSILAAYEHHEIDDDDIIAAWEDDDEELEEGPFDHDVVGDQPERVAPELGASPEEESSQDRYTHQTDFLGNVTIHDGLTGKEAYLQGSEAIDLLHEIEHVQPDMAQYVLAQYDAVMEDLSALNDDVINEAMISRVVIRKTPHDEFRANIQNGPEETAYYGDSLEDAIGTAKKEWPGAEIYHRGKRVGEDIVETSGLSRLVFGKPSAKPIPGHPYHKKSLAELQYILRDASKAAKAMQGHDPKAEAKYRDQVNDACTIMHWRRHGGRQDTPPTTDAKITEAPSSRPKAILNIRSHAGYARWLSEVGEEPVGYIPRQAIPSPYAFSPAHVVYDWHGRKVFSVETRHKHYEVFEVPPDVTIYATDDEATQANMAASKHGKMTETPHVGSNEVEMDGTLEMLNPETQEYEDRPVKFYGEYDAGSRGAHGDFGRQMEPDDGPSVGIYKIVDTETGQEYQLEPKDLAYWEDQLLSQVSE